jgi:carboxyl-terminal processing protease
MRVRPASLRLVPLVGVLLAGCKQDPEPDPNSLAAMEAAGPPHTPDCRAWDGKAFQGLEPLGGGAHVAAFEQVWQTVGLKHYDPTLACLDWLALRDSFGAKVAEAGDDATAAYAAINEMLALLGQSHLHATPPMTSSKSERKGGPATVPIVVRWIPAASESTERALVVVDPALGGHDSGIPRGAVLTKIAGESVEPHVAEFATSAEGAQQAFAVGRGIGAMLSCPEGGSLALEFQDPGAGDAARTLDVPCFLPEGERVSLGNLRDLPTRVDHRLIATEGTAPIGYLAFNFWMLPMVERVEAGLTELRNQAMQGLIIDLRGNPGGVGAMSIPIARMILREDASLGRLQMREFDQEFKVEGNPDAFAGPIAILVDEGTASTSEIFAMGLRDVGRVSVVGACPSAGMALPSMIETLPDGGLIQYVVGDYHSDKGKAAEGKGVEPQVVVDESRADYVAGRDPVLDAALAHLRKQLASPPPSP